MDKEIKKELMKDFEVFLELKEERDKVLKRFIEMLEDGKFKQRHINYLIADIMHNCGDILINTVDKPQDIEFLLERTHFITKKKDKED